MIDAQSARPRPTIEYSQKQWEALTFMAPSINGEPQIEEVAILGEYGGGKTFVAAVRFLDVCLENPFVDGVHSKGDEPTSLMIGPSIGDIKRGPLKEFKRVCQLVCPDHDLIWKERLYGELRFVQLINGHVIQMIPVGGKLNAVSVVQIWCDEIQEDCYDVGKWKNYRGRVRDKRATRLNAQVSGLAQYGHVEDIFRRPDTETYLSRLLFPSDNEENLALGYAEAIDALTPASAERDAAGWLKPKSLLYPKFSKQRNVDPVAHLELKNRKHIPTSFSVDFGSKGAVTFWQDLPIECNTGNGETVKEIGQLAVDQLMPDHLDAEEIAKVIDDLNEWNIEAGKSEITMDPTAERDQLRHFARKFRGVKIVQKKTGPYHKETNGIRATDRAICDKHKNARLFVHPDLLHDPSKRGIINGFQNYREDKLQDKKLEHCMDTVRYRIQHAIPLPDRPDHTPVDVNSKRLAKKSLLLMM